MQTKRAQCLKSSRAGLVQPECKINQSCMSSSQLRRTRLVSSFVSTLILQSNIQSLSIYNYQTNKPKQRIHIFSLFYLKSYALFSYQITKFLYKNRIMKFIDDICQKIVNPPKIRYSPYDLGNSITNHGKRNDFTVVNSTGTKLHASFYQPHQKDNKNVCVIYLHSMNGSRLQSTVYVESILKLGLSFCNFDFTGCGNSEGSTISFGANQKNDVLSIIDNLKEKFKIAKIILWGRSMGSACAIKYCELMHNYKWKDYRRQILGVILDSCFKSFSKLAVQIGHNQSEFPQFLIKFGYHLIKGTLQQKGNFKIDDLQLQEIVGKLEVPVLFLASHDDATVKVEHSQTLFNRYNYHHKKIVYIKGEHNESRDQNYLNQVRTFINDLLKQDKHKFRHASIDLSQINKTQYSTDSRRNFMFQADQWHRQSTDCQCSLFPPNIAKIQNNQDDHLPITRRNYSQTWIMHQKIKLNKIPSKVNLRSSEKLPSSSYFN